MRSAFCKRRGFIPSALGHKTGTKLRFEDEYKYLLLAKHRTTNKKFSDAG